jgi:hypothetical protein
MNKIFSPHIGVHMHVYLDDIVTFSDTPESHVQDVKLVIDTLREHKFYLSEHKLQFSMKELPVAGLSQFVSRSFQSYE